MTLLRSLWVALFIIAQPITVWASINVGSLTTMGAPSGSTYSLPRTAGCPSDPAFSVQGTELVAADGTAAGTYEVCVQATGKGFSTQKTFQLQYAGSGGSGCASQTPDAGYQFLTSADGTSYLTAADGVTCLEGLVQ